MMATPRIEPHFQHIADRQRWQRWVSTSPAALERYYIATVDEDRAETAGVPDALARPS